MHRGEAFLEDAGVRHLDHSELHETLTQSSALNEMQQAQKSRNDFASLPKNTILT